MMSEERAVGIILLIFTISAICQILIYRSIVKDFSRAIMQLDAKIEFVHEEIVVRFGE